ncbi:hypothetical protein NQ315_010916 [Exocentrus adspersus]|uniref:Endoplasmic reticulum resident protein 29 C-terminal domain-containing protein n=1 Tax=Exocentrus adspersus TaxID=1586481 RepID=A0AAV8VP74_9CUCU|nr:hypothetical protein NQ315_010916 [Exocentrus adspersus]
MSWLAMEPLQETYQFNCPSKTSNFLQRFSIFKYMLIMLNKYSGQSYRIIVPLLLKEKHSASTYIKIMRKVVQTKLSFLKKEKNRLKKALSATVNEKKKTELSNHLNILMSFASPKKKKEENSD